MRSSISEIWRQSLRLQEFRSLQISNLAEGCCSCQLKDLCGGGSRSRAYILTGSILGADVACPLSHRFSSRGESSFLTKSPEVLSTLVVPNIIGTTVIGDTANAIRILRKPNGCELRFGQYILWCSEDAAVCLDRMASTDAFVKALEKLLELAMGNSDKREQILVALKNWLKEVMN